MHTIDNEPAELAARQQKSDPRGSDDDYADMTNNLESMLQHRSKVVIVGHQGGRRTSTAGK